MSQKFRKPTWSFWIPGREPSRKNYRGLSSTGKHSSREFLLESLCKWRQILLLLNGISKLQNCKIEFREFTIFAFTLRMVANNLPTYLADRSLIRQTGTSQLRGREVCNGKILLSRIFTGLERKLGNKLERLRDQVKNWVRDKGLIELNKQPFKRLNSTSSFFG